MRAGQKSVRGGIEDFLCPFTDMYITQGSNGKYSHQGTCANDVRGAYSGVRYDYYAPCTCKCLKLYPSTGQSMWQSINKVRFANGRVDYATFMLAHDDNLRNNAWVGKVVSQGDKLGTMGKIKATGVHCHIEISQSSDTSWTKNKYGIYHFNNEYDPDYCYFVDNTNIIYGMGGEWKTLADVPVAPTGDKEYVNLPPVIEQWRIYDLNVAPVKANAKDFLKPAKFGGLSYYVHEYRDGGTTAVIETVDFGVVKIYIQDTCATITRGYYDYEHGVH